MIVMNDFKKEYSYFADEIGEAVNSVLSSGWYILGNQVKSFENSFAEYNGVSYCIGVGNGLEALQIALLALDIGPGDEVITVSHSAVATALAITNIGAKPVFSDIDKYYHLDPAQLESKITKRTKAIVPVHLYGQTADMDPILSVAEKYDIPVIEDACQAAGALYKGKKAGTLGTLGCFSFYPTKNLGAYGDGGAIITDSKELYEKCKMLRNYGQKDRYHHELKGINSRLDEMQAAILLTKLSYLDLLNKRRNDIAKIYYREFNDFDMIGLPKIRENTFHAFHLFVITADNRDQLISYLEEKNIKSLIHYPIPIHKQSCYHEFHSIQLPQTEKAAKHILSLPMHPFLEEDEVVTICNTIKEFYAIQKIQKAALNAFT